MLKEHYKKNLRPKSELKKMKEGGSPMNAELSVKRPKEKSLSRRSAKSKRKFKLKSKETRTVRKELLREMKRKPIRVQLRRKRQRKNLLLSTRLRLPRMIMNRLLRFKKRSHQQLRLLSKKLNRKKKKLNLRELETESQGMKSQLKNSNKRRLSFLKIQLNRFNRSQRAKLNQLQRKRGRKEFQDPRTRPRSLNLNKRPWLLLVARRCSNFNNF